MGDSVGHTLVTKTILALDTIYHTNSAERILNNPDYDLFSAALIKANNVIGKFNRLMFLYVLFLVIFIIMYHTLKRFIPALISTLNNSRIVRPMIC